MAKKFTRAEFREEVLTLTAKAAIEASKNGDVDLAMGISIAGATIAVYLERELFESDDEIEIVKE